VSLLKPSRVYKPSPDTVQVISETIFPANLLTGVKHHSAFSTNHLTDIDKTRHNYNQETTEKPKQPDKKSYAETKVDKLLL